MRHSPTSTALAFLFAGGALCLAMGCSSSPPSSPGDSESILSQTYPGDRGIGGDPAVLFYDGFEDGWGRWDRPSDETRHLQIVQEPALAHAGSGALRSTVTAQQLAEKRYISASTRFTFPRRVEQVYWRFYARFTEGSPAPHHWVRLAAGDAAYSGSGRANTRPAGDEGFWFDLDTDVDRDFNFYVYWHEMRSGRCNDGSTTPGCAGDQGTTYFYGNVFDPPGQEPTPWDAWTCIEIMARANEVGESDGELALWVDGQLVEHYRPGHPVGTWLRATFHTGGCDYSACEEPRPFEGFGFRRSEAVRFKRIFLDAYYERDSFARRQAEMSDRGMPVADESTIYYDDVVVATERIGCRVAP